jgi:hypothetical protein
MVASIPPDVIAMARHFTGRHMITVNEIQPIEARNRFFSLFAIAIIIVPNNILSAAQVHCIDRAERCFRPIIGAIDDASPKTLLWKIMRTTLLENHGGRERRTTKNAGRGRSKYRVSWTGGWADSRASLGMATAEQCPNLGHAALHLAACCTRARHQQAFLFPLVLPITY